MSDSDQEFQQKWDFRRNGSDLSSSSDNHTGRCSAIEPNFEKDKLVSCLFYEGNDHETIQSPGSHPREENNLCFEEPNKPNKSCKEQESKVKPRKETKRMASNQEPSDAGLTELRGYMETLIEGIKVAREDLLKWMNKEMEKSFKDETIPSKPSGSRKGYKPVTKPTQNTKRSKTPNKGKRRSGAVTQKRKGASLEEPVKDKKSSHPTNEEVLRPPNEPQDSPIAAAAAAATVSSAEKSRPGLSVKKQKTDTLPEAANYLTLPSVLPRPPVDNNETNPLRVENERIIGKRSAVNIPVSLSSQLAFLPRVQQKDGVFSQNGLRNTSDYEQNTSSTNDNIRGSGKGNGFPFGLPPQGMNGGVGISNSSQFGLQFLAQQNRMHELMMNGGHTRLPSGNHAFMENYGTSNQQLRLRTQGGVMALQRPDVRGGSLL